MTIEELKKEAEESFEKYRVTDIDYVVSPYSEDEGEKKIMFNNEYDAEEEYFRLYSKGYLAGAEPREKRIAELEGKLKVETELNNRLGVAYREYEQLTKEQDEHLAELEKENAELKEQKEMLEKGYVWHDYDAGEDCYEDTHEGKWVKRDEVYQLTKAKDHIKKLLDCLKQDTNDPQTNYYVCQYMDKAEQFISEVEK